MMTWFDKDGIEHPGPGLGKTHEINPDLLRPTYELGGYMDIPPEDKKKWEPMICEGCKAEIKTAMMCDRREGFWCGSCWPQVKCEGRHPEDCMTTVFDD